MKQDIVFVQKDVHALFTLSDLLRKGYFIVSLNYDAQIDRPVYHLRRTLFSWIFSKIIKTNQ